mgnify:CR=1 FL=1
MKKTGFDRGQKFIINGLGPGKTGTPGTFSTSETFKRHKRQIKTQRDKYTKIPLLMLYT